MYFVLLTLLLLFVLVLVVMGLLSFLLFSIFIPIVKRIILFVMKGLAESMAKG